MAWAAAYILLLQSLLTGIALASIPIGLDNSLCLSAGDSGSSADHPNDNGTSAHVHCEACLARPDTPLLPPLATPILDRIAIELRFDAAVRTALRVFDTRRPFQPRGPPSLSSSAAA